VSRRDRPPDRVDDVFRRGIERRHNRVPDLIDLGHRIVSLEILKRELPVGLLWRGDLLDCA